MDPERQPLLSPVNPDVRCRRVRPLTYEEVHHACQEVGWRRARFCLLLMFWGIMAMFLSIITCMLITAPKCNSYDINIESMPSVPPVHLTLTPLISSGRGLNEEVFTA